MAKYKGKGTILEYLDNDGTTWQGIAQVLDVGPPNMSGESIDCTTHDTPGNFREFIASLRDGGEAVLQIAQDPEDTGSHAKLLKFFETGETRKWRVIFPTPNRAYWAFDGFVNNFGGETPQDDKIMADCAIKISGKPVLNNAGLGVAT